VQEFLKYIPLLAMIADLAIGLFIFIRDPRPRTNKLFLLVAISLAVWALGEFMQRSATTPGAGLAAGRVSGFGWCLVGVFFLHLALEFTHWRRSRWAVSSLFAAYSFALLFLGLTLFTSLIFRGYAGGDFIGMREVKGILRIPSELFVVVLFVAGIVVLLAYRRSTTSAEERARSGYLAVAAAIPLFTGLITDVTLPLLGVEAPFSSQAAAVAMAVIVAVAVTRQGLLTTIAGQLGSTIISEVKDAVFVAAEDGTIETVNEAAVKLSGYDEKGLVGMRVDTLFVGGSSVLRAAGGKQDGQPSTALILGSDGQAIPVSLTTGQVYQKRNRLQGYVLVVHDMRDAVRLIETEHRLQVASDQIERERERLEMLRRSSEDLGKLSVFLESVLENITEPIWIKDREGRFVYANEAFLDMTGYRLDEMFGKRDEDFYWKNSAEFLRRNLDRIFEVGEPIIVPELRVTDKDGFTRTARAMTAPVKGDEGEIEFQVGIISDVTEQKRLESARLDFIRIAAHELRTPLTSLKLGFDILARETRGALNDEQQRSLDILSLSIERLNRLSRNLLDLASMDAGLITLNLQEVELESMFAEAAAVFEGEVKKKGLEMRIVVPPGMRPVRADASRLSQVLYNLVSNAVKYTDQGSITLIAQDPGDGMLRISVADTGTGIPASQRDAIFTRFVKAQSAETAREGTGLGLSITKAIVEAHGGVIEVSSRLGVGSTFSFTVPAAGGPGGP
jgi:PAS domain S-box-containing protein